jgi:glycosyltransferase involved in cell wall biosynthesis
VIEVSSTEDASRRPLVSVCIPTYNRARKLERYVRRLLECDYRNIEVLISDNGSTDDTAAVCESLEKTDSRVACYRQALNLGIIANFEFVRHRASGKYFLWHADDDYLDPHYIGACVDALERNETLVLAYGIAAYHSGDENVVAFGRQIDLKSESAALRTLRYLWKVTENSILCGVYRRNAVRRCVFPGILGGDWAWMSEVLFSGRVERIPGILVYRERGASASSSPEGFKRLVKVLDLPDWQARYPRFAIAAGVASFVLNNPALFSKRFRFQSLPLASAVFVLLLIKGGLPIYARWARLVPGARFVYRRLRRLQGRG